MDNPMGHIRCLFDSEKYCDSDFSEFRNKSTCFLAYSFSEELSKEIQYIKEVLNEEDIEVLDAGSYTKYNKSVLCSKICKNIIGSSFCIALLTGVTPKLESIPKSYKEPNANVYFECGLMTGIGKNVIPLLKRGQDIKFDMRNLELALYDEIGNNPSDFKDKLRKDVKNMLICEDRARMKESEGFLEKFRTDRINIIVNGVTPIKILNKKNNIVLHVVPLTALNKAQNLDLALLMNNLNDFAVLIIG